MMRVTASQNICLSDESLEWKLLSTLFQKLEHVRNIQDDLFTEERYMVFQAMKSCYIEYNQIDFDGVELFLGRELPAEIINATTTDVTIASKKLFQYMLKRNLADKKDKINKLLGKVVIEESELSSLLDLPSFVSEAARELVTNPEFIQDMVYRSQPEYVGRSTGFKALDVRLGQEWKPGKVFMVAAQAGLGKTTFAANAALHAAMNNNEASTIFSLEMSKSDLMVKWAAMILGIDSQLLTSGVPSEDLLKKAIDVVAYLQTLPLFIVDNRNISLARMVSEIRYQAMNLGVKTFFIDYLQIVQHQPTGNVNKDLGSFVQAIKMVTNDLKDKGYGISVIILSQINRNGTIRDTGEAEQHPDVVCYLTRDEEASDSQIIAIEGNLEKNRLGKIGRFQLAMHGATNTFVGMDFSKYWEHKKEEKEKIK